MKIATWNVNGIRACEKAGFSSWLRETGLDAVCLQEVRCEVAQLPENLVSVDPYEPTWHPAKKKGYSGVATLVRGESATTSGLGMPHFDDEGRAIFTRFPGFTLINVYVPNGSRDHSRVPFKLEFYQALYDTIAARHAAGEHVVVCGDWNTAHTAIDLANPKSNEKTTGFLPEERIWIDKFLDLGLVDVFRLRNPGENGHYTWWSQRAGVREKNVGWRLDYFLVSGGIAHSVKQVEHHAQTRGSDHCPVVLEIG